MPLNGSVPTVAAFTRAVKQAAQQNGCLSSLEQVDGLYIEDQTDDSSFTETPSKKRCEQVKLRFLDRLAATVSGVPCWNAATIALMKECTQPDSVNLWLARPQTTAMANQNLQHERQALLKAIEEALRHISRCHGAVNEERNGYGLPDIIYRCYSSRLSIYVQELQDVFSQRKTLFDDLVSKTIGALDDTYESMDYEIGDLINEIRGKSYRPAGEVMNKHDTMDFIKLCHRFTQVPHSQDRMRRHIKAARVSDALYKALCATSKPLYAHDTFVAIARLSPLFSSVSIHYGLPRPGSSQATPVSPGWPMQNQKSKKQEALEHASRFMASSIEDVSNGCRLYLPLAERQLGILQLQPAAKRDAMILLDALLRSYDPSPVTEAYHAFGYAACKNQDEATHLSWLYRTLLRDCKEHGQEKEEMFRDLWRALETHTLLEFFARYDYWGEGLDRIEGPRYFLRTPATRRPTVWRLIQFLRDTNSTDPPNVLWMDYGFNWCIQRDEVQRLKTIYSDILKKARPMELHEACTQGRLLEFGISKGIFVEPRDKRLMQNMRGHPDLGYEGGTIDKGYKGQLFNKRM